MADSFFGFDTSASNLNQHDDEGGGLDASEDEYDALNDETFGGGGEELDWEEQHEEFSAIAEKSRNVSRHNHFDIVGCLSPLDLGKAVRPAHNQIVQNQFSPLAVLPSQEKHSLSSSIWGQPSPQILNGTANRSFTQSASPAMELKNVCTVEELERNLLKQRPSRLPSQVPGQGPMIQGRAPMQVPNMQNAPPFMPNSAPVHHHFPQNPPMNSAQSQMHQNFYQPRFPPMILQRPPGNVNQGNVHPQAHLFNPRTHQQHQGMRGQMPQQQMPMQQMPNQHGPVGPGPQAPMGSHAMANSQINQYGVMMGQPNPNQKQMPGPNHFQKPNFGPMSGPPGMSQTFINSNHQPQPQPFPMQMAPPQIAMQPFAHPKQLAANQNHSKEASKQQMTNQNASFASVKNPQQNPSSASMVQHIQNTHPMLHPFPTLLASSYHNANHHPLINRGGGFFNGQPINNHLIYPQNNLRFNGVPNRNGHIDGSGRDRRDSGEGLDEQGGWKDRDEYAGMMTSREKQWLINIQLIQLNTGTPYMDDYYYTVFSDRKAKQEMRESSEAHKANQQNHPFYSGGKQEKDKDKNMGTRERHNSNRGAGEDGAPRTYVPLQFENSLGKLQCGSVTAPRKIIDVEVVAGEGESSGSQAPKRHKQLLLDIEALYCLLLRLEEMGEPLAIANALILKEREEKQKLLELQAGEEEAAGSPASPAATGAEAGDALLRNIESVQQRQKTLEPTHKKQAVNVLPVGAQSCNLVQKNLLDENKDELMTRIFAGLLHEDKLTSILGVRKGKWVLIRLVRRAPDTACPRWKEVWLRVLRALPQVARRDARDDDLLPMLLPAFRKHMKASSGWELLGDCCNAVEELCREGTAIVSGRSSVVRSSTPTLSRSPLHLALPSSLTLSAIAVMLEKGDSLLQSCPDPGRCERWAAFLGGLSGALRARPVGAARPARPLQESFIRSHLGFMKTHLGALGKPDADAEEALIKYLC